MDARSVLSAQIVVALEDVSAAIEVLGHPAVPFAVRTAAMERLEDAFRDHTGELEKLRLDLAGGATEGECWGRLRSIRTDVQESLRESLAFLGGLLIRQHSMDKEFSSIVDGLLHELALVTPKGIDWPDVTVAIGDAFNPLAATVRTRYPEFSIWALPVVGHEAGHVLIQELRTVSENARGLDFPLVELAAKHARAVNGDVPLGMRDVYRRELFADYLGVWTMGAAYACSSVPLRFVPRTAAEVVARHPPELQRAYVILQALLELDPQYRDVVDLLSMVWSELLMPFDLSPLDGDEADLLQVDLQEVALVLGRHLTRARYNGRDTLATLVDVLSGDPPAPGSLTGHYDIRDVANAAWIARLRNWDDRTLTERVNRSAIAVCRDLLPVNSVGR